MALKMIEVTIGQDAGAWAYDELKEHSVLAMWSEKVANNLSVIRLLVVGRQVESVMDFLTERYGSLEEFRMVVLPVEAALPRFSMNAGFISDSQGRVYELGQQEGPDRMSREELYVTVGDSANPTNAFLALIVLSALVAAIGVLRDNMAIVIGAMVIAPLLGPSIALALGTVLGDMSLIRPALKANALGIGLSYLVAVAIGALLLAVDVAWPTPLRTTLTITDVGLALASGTAGVLGFTSRLSSALVGVMVAVALAPPLVTAGLLVGMGRFSAALPPALLFLTNLICVNLAAVVTFMAQGIVPGRGDETRVASRAVTVAVLVWMAFLIAVVAAIISNQQAGFLSI